MPRKNSRTPKKLPKKPAKNGSVTTLRPSVLLAATNGSAVKTSFRAGKVVFGQGDVSDAVYYVEAGAVEISVISDTGRVGVITVFGAGTFFGEGCLTGQQLRLASAKTTAASLLIRIDKIDMARLLREKPVFSQQFTEFLLTRNLEIEAEIVDHLFNSHEKRLARLLLLLANFNQEGGPRPIQPKVSHEVLAARIGATRSHVNKFMNKFRKLGLIEYNGEVKVHAGLLSVIVHD